MQTGSFLSLTSVDDAVTAAAGHFFVPALFASGAETGDERAYTGSFKLAKAEVLNLDELKSIDRMTVVRAAPLDALGNSRPELAVSVRCEELVLLKTRDLVYNYIGTTGCPGGVCEEKQETFLSYAARDKNMVSGIRPADWFLSHSWGTSFW